MLHCTGIVLILKHFNLVSADFSHKHTGWWLRRPCLLIFLQFHHTRLDSVGFIVTFSVNTIKTKKQTMHLGAKWIGHMFLETLGLTRCVMFQVNTSWMPHQPYIMQNPVRAHSDEHSIFILLCWHRINLHDARLLFKMLCSSAQRGTSGHPNINIYFLFLTDSYCDFQGTLIPPSMDPSMSLQPASVMAPLTQQMGHFSLGNTGAVSNRTLRTHTLTRRAGWYGFQMGKDI